jgi:hypothetical protein
VEVRHWASSAPSRAPRRRGAAAGVRGGAARPAGVSLRRFPAAVALVMGAMVRWSEGKPSLGRGGGGGEERPAERDGIRAMVSR